MPQQDTQGNGVHLVEASHRSSKDSEEGSWPGGSVISWNVVSYTKRLQVRSLVRAIPRLQQLGSVPLECIKEMTNQCSFPSFFLSLFFSPPLLFLKSINIGLKESRGGEGMLSLKWEALDCADAPWASQAVLHCVSLKPLEAVVGAACFWGGEHPVTQGEVPADFSQTALAAAGAGLEKHCSDTRDHALLCPSWCLCARTVLQTQSRWQIVMTLATEKMVDKYVAKNKLWGTHQMAVFNMDLYVT